jgi:hypothetical protein
VNETLRLLARWKAVHGITSDAEAARRLGISRAAVSHWRTRGSHADAHTIVRMCKDCDEDLAECLGRIAGEPRHAA